MITRLWSSAGPQDEAKILTTLTNPSIISLRPLATDWSVDSALDLIARAEPPYLALIDTGALVTGYTNLGVAERLLERGLAHVDGVVFLNEADRKMILLRAGSKVVPLEQTAVPAERRFTFYDQVSKE